jgi:hypothetical protein
MTSISSDTIRTLAKSAGVVPYSYIGNKLYFLFQITHPPKSDTKSRNKIGVLCDFGGKRDPTDRDIVMTASREFSEETSCLFFRKKYEHDDLKALITASTDHFSALFKNMCKEHPYFELYNDISYVVYLYKVDYIPADMFPDKEDEYMNYDVHYKRECVWISYDDLIKLPYYKIHRRLNAVKLIPKLKCMYENDLFL